MSEAVGKAGARGADHCCSAAGSCGVPAEDWRGNQDSLPRFHTADDDQPPIHGCCAVQGVLTPFGNTRYSCKNRELEPSAYMLWPLIELQESGFWLPD